MTEKEKIIAYIDKLLEKYPKNYYLLTVAKFIDSLLEEPVSDFEMALTEMIDNAQKCVVEPWAVAAQWKDYLVELAKSEEPVSEELEKIVEEIAEPTILNAYGTKELARRLRNTIGISVSEDLEEAAKNVGQKYFPDEDNIWARQNYEAVKAECAFKAGAKWQKSNLWKPADGDDLPEIDREVIALLDNGKVVFAHRPPEYWDGKDIDTGKVTRNYPKTYDKGEWNIPNVKWWLDCSMPKEIKL